MNTQIALLVAMITLSACQMDDNAEGAKDENAGKTVDTTKNNKDEISPTSLGVLGLTIDAPAGAKVSEMAGSQMIQASGYELSVEKAGQFSAKTLSEELEELNSSYSGTDVTQEEIEGGWHVTFVNKGGMGKNYWVKSHVTIGGQAFTCGMTSPNEQHQALALAACKTLRQ